MAKLTALQFIQRAMSVIDSDNVTDISETVESEQMKLLLDTVYDRLLNDFPWFHLVDYGTLEVTSTNHILAIPSNVLLLEELRYNKKSIIFIEPSEMIVILDGRDTTLSTVDSSGALNNRDPQYWTSEDDENIIFDSYDGSLASSLSKVRFIRKPVVLNSNSDIPDLPEYLHSVLLDALFEEAFRTLKGDVQTAQIYQRKYISGLGKAKRWARTLNKKESTFGSSYGRRNGTVLRGSDISSRCVIEGS